MEAWWGDVWGRWGGVLAPTAMGLPVAALVVVALARWRRARGSAPGWAWRASVAEVGLVAGTLPWVWMILTPTASAGSGDRTVALVPARDLLAVLAGSPGESVVQVGGNLLVLAAFGFFLPVRFRLGPWRAGLAAAGLSALVEALQYALDLGRVSSVDDVLLNALGAVLASGCSVRWWRLRR